MFSKESSLYPGGSKNSKGHELIVKNYKTQKQMPSHEGGRASTCERQLPEPQEQKVCKI